MKLFTSEEEVFGEVVFNISMTGYQEIITYPSCRGQILVLTCLPVGSYGVNEEDVESVDPKMESLLVRENCRRPQNRRATEALGVYLDRHDVLGAEGIDTSSLTLHLRSASPCNSCRSGGPAAGRSAAFQRAWGSRLINLARYLK